MPKRHWKAHKVLLDPDVLWGGINDLALEMGFEHPFRPGIPDHSALLRAVAKGSPRVVDTLRIAAAVGRDRDGLSS